MTNSTAKVSCSVGFGSATLPVTSVVLSAQKVSAPFSRTSAAFSVPRTSLSRFMVGPVQEFGVLYRTLIEHPVGTVLLIGSRWLRNAASPVRDGAIFLRLRPDAPRWSITATLPANPKNQIGSSFEVFCGHADILGIDALHDIGIVPPRSYESKFMSPEEIDECFVLSKLSEGTPPPSLVVVGSGSDSRVVEVAAAPARRMRFRRA